MNTATYIHVNALEQLTPTQRRIVEEIYKAVESLNGDPFLLGAIGSWGDTLPEAEVLDLLCDWNKQHFKQL